MTDESAAHDAIAKKLVANKAILAYILKYTMDEFEGTPLKVIPKYIEGNPKISQIAVMQDHADIRNPEELRHPLRGAGTIKKIPPTMIWRRSW